MKNLIIISSCSPESMGGLEKVIRDWLIKIDKEKNKIYFFLLDKNNFENKLKSFPFVTLFNFNQVTNNLLGLLVTLIKIKKNSTECICFLHRQFSHMSFLSLLIISLFCRGRIFGMLHVTESAYDFCNVPSKRYFIFIKGIGFWKFKRRLNFFLKSIFMKRIFFVSQDTLDFFKRNYYFSLDKCEVSYHGVDTKKLVFSERKRLEIRQELMIKQDDLVFVSLGRIASEKRLDRIIGAFILAVRKLSTNSNGKKHYLLIIGDGELRKKFEKRTKKYQNILFLRKREDIDSILSAADFFINGSDVEGFSLALLEACSIGLIPVCVDVAGTRDLWKLIDLPLGVSARNVFSLSRKIIETNMLNDLSAWREKIHSQIDKKFNVDQNVTEILEKIDIKAY